MVTLFLYSAFKLYAQ